MYRKIEGQHSRQSIYDSIQAERTQSANLKKKKRKNKQTKTILKYLTSTDQSKAAYQGWVYKAEKTWGLKTGASNSQVTIKKSSDLFVKTK